MTASEIICCSLEPWDEVWRRNQFFADALIRSDPSRRILFVEPPLDVTYTLARSRRWPGRGRPAPHERIVAFRPLKWLPRRVDPGVDSRLGRQVARRAHRLGFTRPVLWVNDNSYAGLARDSGWPSVYDVTDDWLEASGTDREVMRQRYNDRLMMDVAGEVVVCSPGLEASRGAHRSVHLIQNGVDVDHFRRPTERPADLPDGPVALYSGTVIRGRIDIELSIETARALTGKGTLTFVGPMSLDRADIDRLAAVGARLLGPRPYAAMPAYLQYSDVLVVPHEVTAFTESLDPIKAREIEAVARPCVTTPVAGMRDLGFPVVVADPAAFASEVVKVLGGPRMPAGPGPLTGAPISWDRRAAEFERVLCRAAGA